MTHIIIAVTGLVSTQLSASESLILTPVFVGGRSFSAGTHVLSFYSPVDQIGCTTDRCRFNAFGPIAVGIASRGPPAAPNTIIRSAGRRANLLHARLNGAHTSRRYNERTLVLVGLRIFTLLPRQFTVRHELKTIRGLNDLKLIVIPSNEAPQYFPHVKCFIKPSNYSTIIIHLDSLQRGILKLFSNEEISEICYSMEKYVNVSIILVD